MVMLDFGQMLLDFELSCLYCKLRNGIFNGCLLLSLLKSYRKSCEGLIVALREIRMIIIFQDYTCWNKCVVVVGSQTQFYCLVEKEVKGLQSQQSTLKWLQLHSSHTLVDDWITLVVRALNCFVNLAPSAIKAMMASILCSPMAFPSIERTNSHQ